MTSYYEDLGISPEVSVEAIQAAIDTRYNQWRELVTHPDAEMRAEAERNQRLLEQMRSTLTDPIRRAAYDAGIGLSGLGGLADPMAVLQRAAPPPPKPKKGAAQSGGEAGGSGLWTCPKCATDNPPQTNHCFNCGTQLVRACPTCGQMASLIATGFCGNCGARYEIAVRMKKVEEEQTATTNKINQTQAELDSINLEQQRLKVPVVSWLKIAIGSIVIFYIIRWFLYYLIGIYGILPTVLAGLPILAYLIFVVARQNAAKNEIENERSNIIGRQNAINEQLRDTKERMAALDAEHQKLEKQLRQRA